jgi:hypothetical protein
MITGVSRKVPGRMRMGAAFARKPLAGVFFFVIKAV